MEMNLWWIWIIVAALFVVGEIFTAGFFLLWFGIGAAAAALAASVGLATAWQLGVFVVSSFLLLAVSRRFADRISREQPAGIGADRFLGVRCVVLEDIDNFNNTGRVRMNKEEWRAASATGDVIESGQEVSVTGVSGTQLIVKAASD